MADKEISGLTAAAALAAADIFIASQGGNSRKVTGAQLATFAGNPQPAFIAGRWYPMANAIVAAGSVGQNLIQFSMFQILSPITVSDLGCSITTALAANNVQLAIYAADPATLYPTGNALAVTGSISTASTGSVSADITGANVSLANGFFWAAVNHSGATSVVQAVNTLQSLTSSKVGSPTLASIATNAASALKLTFASTFNTWPDMTGQTLTEATPSAGVSPMLYLKAA